MTWTLMEAATKKKKKKKKKRKVVLTIYLHRSRSRSRSRKVSRATVTAALLPRVGLPRALAVPLVLPSRVRLMIHALILVVKVRERLLQRPRRAKNVVLRVLPGAADHRRTLRNAFPLRRRALLPVKNRQARVETRLPVALSALRVRQGQQCHALRNSSSSPRRKF